MSMILRWAVVATVCCCVGASPGAVSCSPASRRVLSHDYSLVLVANITASSEDTLSPARHLVSRSNAPSRLWCSQPHTGRQHHLNLSFQQPVLLEQIISAGYSNGFVSNFSVQYFRDWKGQYMLYRDTYVQQFFVVPQIDTVFVLEEALVARQLKLLVHDGLESPSGRMCWHLTLLGCLLEHAETQSVDASPSPQLCLDQGGEGGGVVLGVIAGSMMAGTVLLVVLAVILTILACRRSSNHKLLCFSRGHRHLGAATSTGSTRRSAHINKGHRRPPPLRLTGIDTRGVVTECTCQRNLIIEELDTQTNSQADKTISGIHSGSCHALQSPATEASPYEVPTSARSYCRESMIDNIMYSMPYEHIPHSRLSATRITLLPNECYDGSSPEVVKRESMGSIEKLSQATQQLADISADYDEIP